MDERRVGRALRAIRRARRLRQADVAGAAGVSRATVSDIERGLWRAMPMRTLVAVFAQVDADVDVMVRHRGAELDRLMDAAHAAGVAAVAALLRSDRWLVELETTFNHYGDRGSIDLLAYHTPSRTLLVVEVKTEIASAEEMLRRLDMKARLGPTLASARFGEQPGRVARLLAVTATSANRARVARLDALLGPVFALRGRALAGWLRDPGPLPPGARGGLLFIRNVGPGGTTSVVRRVRRPAAPAEAGRTLRGWPGDRVACGSSPLDRR
jgi:transcriptional regulator with XRE-family HTH domain